MSEPELGILFRGDMVRAILAGAKTVTRRAMKPQPTMAPDPAFWRPRYNVGRIVWVRETHQRALSSDGAELRYIYAADYSPDEVRALRPWTPSILMPRQASRITLRIVSARAERLGDIDAADVVREGLPHAGLGTTVEDYHRLYLQINPGATLKSWVWRYEFEEIR